VRFLVGWSCFGRKASVFALQRAKVADGGPSLFGTLAVNGGQNGDEAQQRQPDVHHDRTLQSKADLWCLYSGSTPRLGRSPVPVLDRGPIMLTSILRHRTLESFGCGVIFCASR